MKKPNFSHWILAASAVSLAALILASCSQRDETATGDHPTTAGPTQSPQSDDHPTAGGTSPTAASPKTAPDFALTDLSGKTVRLSDFKGKVVLLNFWATWCPPCRKEIPDLIQLEKQYADKSFTVLGIALDQDGTAAVKPFAQRNAINYPLVLGNSEVTAAYGGIEAIPTTFLIEHDGRVLKTYVGTRDKSEFQQDIQLALLHTATQPTD